jgi:acylphosphatase
VQGVGFREFVVRHALALRLTGYVRNLPDGRSVEIVAEGDKQALDRLAAHLSQGPRSAVVQSTETHWAPATGGFAGFDIRY